MNIGFDAKRAFNNKTGLGNYARTLIFNLNKFYPEFNLFLFTPKIKLSYNFPTKAKLIQPENQFYKHFSSWWRLYKPQFLCPVYKLNIFHGLSNELPLNIKKTPTKQIVTFHDIIFHKFPQFFSKIDRTIYKKKTLYACNNSDIIISVSNYTKNDLINYFNVKEEKIRVIYQSISEIYYKNITSEELIHIRKKYNLPQYYLLYVGAIEPRKNLLSVCKAIYRLNDKFDLPLVVIGKGKAYFKEVYQYCLKNNLINKVHFLSYNPRIKNIDEQIYYDLPAIFKLATTFIYPSLYEGFGIPIIEALHFNIPVITSNVSCLPEIAGKDSILVDPYHLDSIMDGLQNSLRDDIRKNCIQNGKEQLKIFHPNNCSKNLANIYNQLS